jgi:hypothetical protein
MGSLKLFNIGLKGSSASIVTETIGLTFSLVTENIAIPLFVSILYYHFILNFLNIIYLKKKMLL